MSLYQRSSDNRWVARCRTDEGYRYVTGTDRDEVARRAADVPGVTPPPPIPGAPRFWDKVLRGTNCWLWVGGRSSLGYGQYRVGKTRVKAHRHAYELLIGPIPAGLTLDHLCCNPWCVNPWHMEPVTLSENSARRHQRALLAPPSDPRVTRKGSDK